MPILGLGNKLTSMKATGITSPGIVTSNLVLKHNYAAGSVIPVSDGAALFDGSNDYIDCGSDSSIDMGTSAFSASFWMYMNVVETACFMGKGPSVAGGDKGWAISCYGTNSAIYFDINDSAGATRDVAYSSTGALTANKWIHISVVKPSGTTAGRKIYINGAEDTASAEHDTADCGDADIDLYLGDVNGQTRALDGYMCNVGLWKGRVLTQPEVKSIMNKNYAGLTSSEKTSLVSWWNLSEDATDSLGLNNGTATNF